MYLEDVKQEQGNYQADNRSQKEMIIWATPFVKWNEESSGQIPKDVIGFEPRINSDSGIVNDLGQDDQILSHNHPDIKRKEIS